jgi:hypothetical protein
MATFYLSMLLPMKRSTNRELARRRQKETIGAAEQDRGPVWRHVFFESSNQSASALFYRANSSWRCIEVDHPNLEWLTRVRHFKKLSGSISTWIRNAGFSFKWGPLIKEKPTKEQKAGDTAIPRCQPSDIASTPSVQSHPTRAAEQTVSEVSPHLRPN